MAFEKGQLRSLFLVLTSYIMDKQVQQNIDMRVIIQDERPQQQTNQQIPQEQQQQQQQSQPQQSHPQQSQQPFNEVNEEANSEDYITMSEEGDGQGEDTVEVQAIIQTDDGSGFQMPPELQNYLNQFLNQQNN